MIRKEKVVKSVLTKSKIGEYAINSYIGCPHKCRYCYASFMKRFTNHPEEWGDFIDIKVPKEKINIEKIKGKNIFISTVTDPYNPYEAKYKRTREVLEQLQYSDSVIQIATKSKLILRDLDLLKNMKNLSVAISINTLDESFKSDMDRASSIKDRLETLQTLYNNGIYTILFMSPIFIGITNWKEIIEKTKSYINEYWFEDLNLRGAYKYSILRYIKEKYPNIYPLYETIYIQGNKQELIKMDNKIREYCDKNNINYSDYFHHEEVIGNSKNRILGKNKK